MAGVNNIAHHRNRAVYSNGVNSEYLFKRSVHSDEIDEPKTESFSKIDLTIILFFCFLK